MGFTLRAALACLRLEASVLVAELVPAVARWARGPLSTLFEDSLDDPRVELRLEDVNRTIQLGQAQYDAILLDVDNGPDGLTWRANDCLYHRGGLKRARHVMTLIVSPIMESAVIEVRTASGIEIAIISVERQLRGTRESSSRSARPQ
jgi:spermidine synthase